MLGFLRRHQKVFFIVMSVVIIVSFSFFGTYSSMASPSPAEKTAFTAIDGSKITRYELDEMALFLGTDSADKKFFGGIWGPNFLNDGVLVHDFLETGLALELFNAYCDQIKTDLDSRFDKEKRYSPYKHPQAQFISVESAWGYFYPPLKESFQKLRSEPNAATSAAFDSRVQLFLQEKKFASPLLRQILQYQERQYGWVSPDPSLEQIDLSLFGYHTFEDWFGPRFIKIAAEFIINAAKIAEERGYHISKEEALADLYMHSETSYRENLKSPHLGVASSSEYFQEQLRRMGMDQNRAVKVWRQVLLFRRLFHDIGNGMWVDPVAFQSFDQYANETVVGTLYRLPAPLRIDTYRGMQRLEVYLDAVSKRTEEDKKSLLLPKKFLAPQEVSKKYPQLVQKRYLLEISTIDKKDLQESVSVRDTWKWETEERNWEKLKKQFPILGIKKGASQEERFAILNEVDRAVRYQIDSFSRSAILDERPEGILAALNKAPKKREIIALHEKGGKPPFAGLKNGLSLIQLLDKAPMGRAPSTAEEEAVQKQLEMYSANQSTYYSLKVIDRAEKNEVMTFAEAEREGVLDEMLDHQLEAYYPHIRDSYPDYYKKPEGSWKAFADVKDMVADHYFEKTLSAIRKDYASVVGEEAAPKVMISDFSAPLRLYAHMRELQGQLAKDSSHLEEISAPVLKQSTEDFLDPRASLHVQWKLERVPYEVTRSKDESLLDKTELFSLQETEWTKVNTHSNGDLAFFQVEKKTTSQKSSNKLITEARSALSGEVQRKLMGQLLVEIQKKNAISLEYMTQSEEHREDDV